MTKKRPYKYRRRAKPYVYSPEQLARVRAREHELREQRRAAGICVRAGCGNRSNGHGHCDECLEFARTKRAWKKEQTTANC